MSMANADDEGTLLITPSRCIALHQGQSCYQKITLQWHYHRPVSACLFVDSFVEPLGCWEQVSNGQSLWEFEGEKSQKFQLIETTNQTVLLQNELQVVWVYDANSKRQSHWRLF